MVSNTVAFSDEIITSSELKRHWSQWIKKAHDHPVTIMYKNDPLALVSRKLINELSKQIYYTYLLVSFSQNYIENRTGRRSALSWAAYLSDRDRRDFFKELLSAYEESYAKDDWSIIQDVLDDWKATAEVERSPELSKALMAEEDPSKYVKLEG